MSYVQVPSKTVIKVCNKWMKFIHNYRAYNEASLIKYEAYEPRWLCKPWGYQKAFDQITKNRVPYTSDQWWSASCAYYEVEHTCKKLLCIASIGDPVTITDDHVFIFDSTVDFDMYGGEQL